MRGRAGVATQVRLGSLDRTRVWHFCTLLCARSLLVTCEQQCRGAPLFCCWWWHGRHGQVVYNPNSHYSYPVIEDNTHACKMRALHHFCLASLQCGRFEDRQEVLAHLRPHTSYDLGVGELPQIVILAITGNYCQWPQHRHSSPQFLRLPPQRVRGK